MLFLFLILFGIDTRLLKVLSSPSKCGYILKLSWLENLTNSPKFGPAFRCHRTMKMIAVDFVRINGRSKCRLLAQMDYGKRICIQSLFNGSPLIVSINFFMSLQFRVLPILSFSFIPFFTGWMERKSGTFCLWLAWLVC